MDQQAMTALHQRLVSLVLVIQHLGETQVAQILQFLDFEPSEVRWKLSTVSALLQRVDEQQLAFLLYDCGDLPCDDPAGNEFIQSLSDTERSSFTYLYNMYLLQDVMRFRFNDHQLMLVCEMIPNSPNPEYQFQILQLQQQLLVQLMPDQLLHLSEVDAAQRPEQLQHLVAELDARFGLVCDGVLRLLEGGAENMLAIQAALPALLPLQLVQLLRISKIDPFDVLQLSQWLSPDAGQGSRGLHALLEDPMDEEMSLQLRVVEQPPEKSVYKRNLKPNPRVMVVGDTSAMGDEQLVVVPKLCRCDTQEILEDKLTGHTPVVVTGGSMAVFKRLKLLCTTRQNDGSLLSIRFELRRLGPDQKPGELLTFVHSNPIVVVSHTTQMHEPVTQLASVIEAIPGSGPTCGGTRVAVIGHNFLQCDKARVQFGESEVSGQVYGEGTIVCMTPHRDRAERVDVRVTNDGRQWSSSAASFEYVDVGGARRTFEIAARADGSACDFNEQTYWPGDIQDFASSSASMTFQSLTSSDGFGNTPLHHAVARNMLGLVKRMLTADKRVDPNIQNYSGETLLHVAARRAPNVTMVKLLVEHGAAVNATDAAGATPLHALCGGCEDAAVFETLLQYGAQAAAGDEDGDTPLHWAVRERNSAAVSALLSHAQHVCARVNDDGENALHVAAAAGAGGGAEEIVERLLGAGCDATEADLCGTTPLGAAVEAHASALIGRLMAALPAAGAKGHGGGSAARVSEEAKASRADGGAAAAIAQAAPVSSGGARGALRVSGEKELAQFLKSSRYAAGGVAGVDGVGSSLRGPVDLASLSTFGLRGAAEPLPLSSRTSFAAAGSRLVFSS